MKNILLLGLLCYTSLSCSQNFEVVEEKLVSGGIEYPLSEPHLVIDPNDPNHFIGASILTTKWEEGSPPKSHIVVLQSWDEGKSWNEKHFDHNITLGADPWLSMNKKGTLILTSLNRMVNKRSTYLLCFVSNDGGKTWDDNYLNLGFAHDRQSIVIDPKSQDFIICSSKFNQNSDGKSITGISITRLASDGSLRYSNWHAMSNVDQNNSTPVINDQGDLLIPYIDYMANYKRLQTRRNWMAKSNDLGRTITENIFLGEDAGSFPYIALSPQVDTSAQKLYYLSSKGKFKEYKGFTLRTSNDYGYTWNDKVDIDQYMGGLPYIRGAQMAINNDGVIAVLWFDRRGINDNENGHNLYFSFSNDEGKTFQKPIKISSKPSFPDETKNGMVDKRWPVGGDYFGLCATDKGNFRVLWVDHRDGKPQLYFAKIDMNE
ncbi:MAG: sialidase family protein [Bacteroidota bacterium]